MRPGHGEGVYEDACDDERLPDQRKQHPALEPALTRSRIGVTESGHEQAVVAGELDDEAGDEDRGGSGQEVQSSGRVCVSTQAASADASAHHSAPYPHISHLKVWQESAVRANLGMAHIVAILRGFPADFTSLCHD